MLQVHQFPVLQDNYAFLIRDPASGETATIDTPDAGAILAEADKMGWKDRKSTRLNSSHIQKSRMPSSA